MRQESIECRVSDRALLVPLHELERVVEFALSPPPPLCEEWVAGLGVVGGEPLVCVSLSGEGHGPQAVAKGLLLRGGTEGQRYLVRVDEVRAVGVASRDALAPLTPPRWTCPVGWLVGNASEAGPLRLSTDAVAAALFGEDSAAPLRADA